MIEINGKEYELNSDITLRTQKLMGQIQRNPNDPKNELKVEYILKDLLIPSPSKKDLLDFRMSDIERVGNAFNDEMEEEDKEAKKKLSQ